MKLLAVVTPLSIYHGCSTRKTFWEGNFTLANMKSCGCCNVRKHREIKSGDQCIDLDIYLNFGNMEKMKCFSETKDYLGRSGKGLTNSLGLKTIKSIKKIKRQDLPLPK